MRGHAAGARRRGDRQHLRRDRRGRAPGAPGDPPGAPRAAGRAHHRHRLRRADRPRRLRRACPRSIACSATPRSCARELDAARRAACAVADIMAVRETAAHLIDRFAGRARAFVEVQQGCDHRCTFCIIPYRPRPIRSVPVGDVVAQVRALVGAGLSRAGADRRRHHRASAPTCRASPSLGQLVPPRCWRWCPSWRGCGCPRSTRPRSTMTCGG